MGEEQDIEEKKDEKSQLLHVESKYSPFKPIASKFRDLVDETEVNLFEDEDNKNQELVVLMTSIKETIDRRMDAIDAKLNDIETLINKKKESFFVAWLKDM